MKKTTLRNWTLQSCASDAVADADATYRAIEAGKDNSDAYVSELPAQVHDILIDGGIISGSVRDDGRSHDCMWVGQTDWVYRTAFDAPPRNDRAESPVFLRCAGLDTACDIYLNGRHLAFSQSMYLPVRVDISAYLRPRNELILYFHRHAKMVEYYKSIMPDEWKGHISPRDMLRKSHDYGSNEKEGNGYGPIGIFDEVCLETPDRAEIFHADTRVEFSHGYDTAFVAAELCGAAYGAAVLTAEVVVAEEDGANSVASTVSLTRNDGVWSASARAAIHAPKLWWPKNYGDQPLYRVTVRLFADGEPVDEMVKPLGLREFKLAGDMAFECNGVPVRMWGCDIAPIWGPSNTFNPEVAFDLIDKLELSGINAVRIWGPNKPYPDAFYDRFDRAGIMVWQDFPTGCHEFPPSGEHRRVFRKEAEHMIHRLMHHPSIYLWCGGNENIYMTELLGHYGTMGHEVLTRDFKEACLLLDHHRYYHVSCPYGGNYVNDPSFGDSHGSRAFRSFCPGEEYGVFFSENIRVFPPQYKSFARWKKEALWEEGYIDAKYYGDVLPVPKPWKPLIGTHGEEKFGPVWDYYAADNARDLIYKFTDAAGQDIYRMFARSRHGNPPHKSHERAAGRGYMLWKANDPWPRFYCALVDYYGECSLPYYSVKRAVRPLLIDFEVADHVYVWGVNDTREHYSGTVEITLYNLESEEIRKVFSIPVSLAAGTSRVIADLDSCGALRWFTLLHLRFLDTAGNEILGSNAYVTKENMLPFHDAGLTLTQNGDTVTVVADKFARCVELAAGEDGNAFGWVFDDNYFDLFPFETKTVKIVKRGAEGRILARSRYSSRVFSVKDNP